MIKLPVRLVAALLTLAAGLGALIVFSFTGSTPARELDDCLLKQTGQITQQVIDSEAKCLVETALEASDSPLAAAEQIRVLLTTPGRPDEACHLLGHAVGRTMSKQLGEDAIVPGQSWCEDSYYHGLMTEEMRASSSTADKLADRICAVLTAPEALRALDPDRCRLTVAHGTGHAVYAKAGNLDRGIEICSSIDNAQQEQCAYGVVMEQTIQAGAAINAPKLADQGYCAKVDDVELAAGCYSGITELAVDRGELLEAVCGKAQGWASRRCSYSFGSYVTVGISTAGEGKYTAQLGDCVTNEDCARGLGAMRFLWTRDLGEADRFCDRLLGELPTLQPCRRAVELASAGRSGLE